jgi:hypothetical protein
MNLLIEWSSVYPADLYYFNSAMSIINCGKVIYIQNKPGHNNRIKTNQKNELGRYQALPE